MDELTRLLLAARDGDRLALDAAIRRAQPDVWRLAARLVGRPEADDVTQETFLRAYRALPAYRGEAGGRTWLLAIARRTCADWVRRAQRQRRLAGRVGQQVRPASRPDDTGALALEELVASLTDDQRAAFVLTQSLGLSYAEAAEVCGVPVGTIRSRVARARAHILEQLAADEATG